MQPLIEGVVLLLLGNLVQAECTLFRSGQWTRLVLAALPSSLFDLVKGATADRACRGCRRGCANVKGPLQHALVIMRFCGRRGEGAVQQGLGDVCVSVCHAGRRLVATNYFQVLQVSLETTMAKVAAPRNA